MMQLCETTDKATGNKRYYIDGIRVNRDKFEYTEILYKRWDTIYSTGNKKVTRSFKNVSQYN